MNANSNELLIEESQSFRVKFGLKSDIDYVENVLGSENTDNSFGVILTKEEAAMLNNRIEILNDLVPKMSQYLTNREDAFSGIYANQREGGTIYILLSNDVDEYNQTKIQQDLLDIHDEKIEVKYINVKYSKNKLESFEKIVFDILKDNNLNFYMSIDIKENKIKIQSEKTEQVAKLLDSVLPNDIYVLEELQGENIDDSRDGAPIRPLQGGLALESYTGTNICSSGFSAHDNNGNWYLITAGHCKAVSTWYQGGEYVGYNSGYYQQSGYLDARAIKIHDSFKSYYVYHWNPYGRRLEDSNDYATSSYVGQLVCKSGYKTHTDCGEVLSINESGNWGGRYFSKLRRADYPSSGGDSGGTVYSGNRLVGINKGRNPDGYAVYSDVTYIDYYFDLVPYVY